MAIISCLRATTARLAGIARVSAECRDLYSRFFVMANGTFLMLAAILRSGCLFVNNPLKYMFCFICSSITVIAIMPVICFIRRPFLFIIMSKCRNLYSCFLIMTKSAFLMLAAILRGSCFFVNNPLKYVFCFICYCIVVIAIIPMICFIRKPSISFNKRTSLKRYLFAKNLLYLCKYYQKHHLLQLR